MALLELLDEFMYDSWDDYSSSEESDIDTPSEESNLPMLIYSKDNKFWHFTKEDNDIEMEFNMTKHIWIGDYKSDKFSKLLHDLSKFTGDVITDATPYTYSNIVDKLIDMSLWPVNYKASILSETNDHIIDIDSIDPEYKHPILIIHIL